MTCLIAYFLADGKVRPSVDAAAVLIWDIAGVVVDHFFFNIGQYVSKHCVPEIRKHKFGAL